jgi:hypothetical protein
LGEERNFASPLQPVEIFEDVMGNVVCMKLNRAAFARLARKVPEMTVPEFETLTADLLAIRDRLAPLRDGLEQKCREMSLLESVAPEQE